MDPTPPPIIASQIENGAHDSPGPEGLGLSRSQDLQPQWRPGSESSVPWQEDPCNSQCRGWTGKQCIPHRVVQSVWEVKLLAKAPNLGARVGHTRTIDSGRANTGDPGEGGREECLSFGFIEG